jgi:hypothetical protein
VGASSPSKKKRRRKLPRPHLPRAPRLAGIAVLTGMVGAAAMLLIPVDAAVGSDPLLRLRTFDAAPATADTVECGPVLGDAGTDDARADLYGMARDKACREASDRRMLSAGAAAAIVALTGLLALAASAARAGR